jgi:hypothetical protein
MSCKILGSQGGDYEECRLLGYISQVHISQKTHYISATELYRLMLCKIRGLHSGYHEKFFRSLRRLLVIANVFPSSPILSDLMMEALRFTETSVLRTAIERNIPVDDILGLTY